MSEPNEDINQELSTDELKSVSGGLASGSTTWNGAFRDPTGSGSGMSRKDWLKSKEGKWSTSCADATR